MRPLDDIQRRWRLLFDNSIGVDLRQAVRESDGFNPCEQGLRSVCWKAFLLFGPMSQASWSKKLSESRSAYSSLRDHFLRFIEHPNDLHSTTDPLADDDTSPWSTLRQDEINREEIFQDVTRCMQDNYFFREPGTQKKLLDILFIYSKLNPDLGYRQGMHELLAPIIWVVHQDSIDFSTVPEKTKKAEGTDFMLEVLDHTFIEHDAFSLFCALMQSAKSFYEMGDNKDSSPIITRSRKIHDELLASIDPELALHLQVVSVLPQIYSIRWLRLLFGREFDFKDVLRMWDIIFADNLRPDIIDMTCVAMLLRIRWELLEADYATAITMLSRYNLPNKSDDPRILVKDALYLDRNRTTEAGAYLIQEHSGRKPKQNNANNSSQSLPRVQPQIRGTRTPQHKPSPSASPARFTTPQKQLESLFQEVSGNLQRRTEGLNKVVRGAVGEVRRNVSNFQTSHSRPPSIDVTPAVHRRSSIQSQPAIDQEIQRLDNRIKQLEARNKALAKMLDGTMEELRLGRLTSLENKEQAEETFNISLAKIQFVSVYLADSDIPLPSGNAPEENDQSESSKSPIIKEGSVNTTEIDRSERSIDQNPTVPKDEAYVINKSDDLGPLDALKSPKTNTLPAQRPSLADSSFSFMLGEDRHRSSFVSSVTALPEQRRDSESKGKPKPLWKEVEHQQDPKSASSTEDGFTLNSLHGGQQH